MSSPDSRSRDARWRARVWRSVDRMQRDHNPKLRLVPGAATRHTARRASLCAVDGQTSKRN